MKIRLEMFITVTALRIREGFELEVILKIV